MCVWMGVEKEREEEEREEIEREKSPRTKRRKRICDYNLPAVYVQ